MKNRSDVCSPPNSSSPAESPEVSHLSGAVRRCFFDELSRNDSPLYIYESDTIRSVCRMFSFPFPHVSVHFATMANCNRHFLQILKEEGLNVFVNSLPHLGTVLAAGFSGERIVFTASAMNDETMRRVRDAGAVINLDSIGQIRRWSRLFPDVSFGIRCNIGEQVEAKNTRGGYFIGKDSRLGLLPGEIGCLQGNPKIRGLHLYAGTDICSVEYFRDCYEALCGYAALFPGLEYLDFGGGFGLHDDSGIAFDLSGYGEMLSSLVKTINAGRAVPLQVILEPGRIIGAQAGYFVCTVVDVKLSGERQLIGVNASSVQFPRPLLYPDSAIHPVTILPQSADGGKREKMISSISGCSTYSRDFLARDVFLPQAAEGDIVVFGEAGAYCASSYTSFLGFEPAKEVFI